MSRIRYVGITRFSVVNAKNSGFLIDSADRKKYLRELFNDERLLDRMFILEKVAAPVYNMLAEKHDYTHLIQYSPELPVVWKQRLLELSQKFPCIVPVEVIDADIADSVREYVLSWEKDFIGEFVWFRIDDDDVLSLDFLDAVERYVSRETVGFALSFGRVYSGIFSGGQFMDLHRVHSPFNSQGQAYICRANLPLGIIESPGMVPHHRPNLHVPVIVQDLEPYAFWTRHPLQDTLTGTSSVGARVANLQADLGAHEHADYQEVLRKFPTLHECSRNGRIDSSEQIQLQLTVDQWAKLPEAPAELKNSTIYRVRYEIDFYNKPDSSCTLWLDFEDKDSVSGFFPRDGVRGDYRRMFCDKFGHGEILIMLDRPLLPMRVRFVSDNKSSPRANILIERVRDIRGCAS